MNAKLIKLTLGPVSLAWIQSEMNGILVTRIVANPSLSAHARSEKKLNSEIERSQAMIAKLMKRGKLIEAESERRRMRFRRMDLGYMPMP